MAEKRPKLTLEDVSHGERAVYYETLRDMLTGVDVPFLAHLRAGLVTQARTGRRHRWLPDTTETALLGLSAYEHLFEPLDYARLVALVTLAFGGPSVSYFYVAHEEPDALEWDDEAFVSECLKAELEHHQLCENAMNAYPESFEPDVPEPIYDLRNVSTDRKTVHSAVASCTHEGE